VEYGGGKGTSEVIFECDKATIDISQYPIIIQRLKPVDLTLDQTNAYVHLLNDVVHHTSGPFVIITDSTNSVYLNLDSKLEIAKGIHELERKHLDRYTMSVVVVPSLTMRSLLEGMNFFMRPIAPQLITNTFEEAYEKAKELIGVPFS
jgi:hypothetical protein